MGKQPIWIAGAGLSGAVIARQLAEADHKVTIFESRDHIAGNCFTERDDETGVLVHRYGPHIFHTGDEGVWEYVNRFAAFRSYDHRVWTTVKEQVFPLPISLATINQFYRMSLSPDEAKAFVASKSEHIPTPETFEEQAKSHIGHDLYEAFFKGYTEKQWGLHPRDLPASILKRLPVRFSYETSYFNHPIQAMPVEGYTPMVASILDHPGITVHLNTPLKIADVPDEAHLFWSGPFDAYFDHALGHLGYRTLDFEHSRHTGDFQGCPVMNYGDADVPFTRITEHKHFAPWEDHNKTIVTHEYSRACEVGDIPYYPIRLAKETALLDRYLKAAEATVGVTFVGRLGTYRYLDMDVCIRAALDTATAYLDAQARGGKMPAILASSQ